MNVFIQVCEAVAQLVLSRDEAIINSFQAVEKVAHRTWCYSLRLDNTDTIVHIQRTDTVVRYTALIRSILWEQREFEDWSIER